MKNLLLFSVVLLMSYTAMAQLYVTPNGATDSYVYVNDEILFVEQDVNLVANNAGTTEASLYLRNEAQLIQGATSSANSGTGFISVYQDSYSDSYDYNFWGTPVGNPALAPSGNVNFGVLNFYDANTVTDSDQAMHTGNLNGIASPNLTISRRWLYKRTGGGGYQALGSTYGVDPGLGFTMKGVGVTPAGGDPFQDPINQNYDFRGRPNNGNISVPVAANASTLAGNPYPSAIDMNLVFQDPDNIEIQEFRYWDEDRSINSHNFTANKGGYGIWVPGVSPYVTGGTYTRPTFLNYDSNGNPMGPSGGMGEDLGRLYAPIGQGFNIFANVAGDGQIYFKNSHRVYQKESGNTNSNFRGAQGSQTSSPSGGSVSSEVDPLAEYPPTLRVMSMFGNSHFREMLLVLSPLSTDGYDRGLDARHPMDGAKAEVYFPIVDDNGPLPYVIQTVPFDTGKKVPLTFEMDQQMSVSFTAIEEINLPSKVYLWDKRENLFQEITNGSEADFILPAGNYENRFFLVFRGGPDTDDSGGPVRNMKKEVTSNVDFFQNNPVAQLEVRNPEGYEIKSAAIFDMSGKLVLSEQNLGNSERFTFSTATFSDGVYIVKLTTTDNVEIDYRMTVHNKR